MRTPRKPARLVLGAVIATSLLLTGCASSSPTPSPSGSATVDVVAPAGATEFGMPAGTGAITIDLWTDLSCPFCQMLEAETGEIIAQGVSDGEVTFVIHPLNFVSGKHGDETDWSTRAANALAAVLDAGQGDHLPAFYALLQEHQSDANDKHPTDADILELATEAGVTADISDAVATLRFGPWVAASNEHWLGRTISGTDKVVQGVPILAVDGKVLSFEDTSDVAGTLQSAIDAARG